MLLIEFTHHEGSKKLNEIDNRGCVVLPLDGAFSLFVQQHPITTGRPSSAPMAPTALLRGAHIFSRLIVPSDNLPLTLPPD